MSRRDLLSRASSLPSTFVFFERSAFVKIVLVCEPVSKMLFRPKDLYFWIFRLELRFFIQVLHWMKLFYFVVSLAIRYPFAIHTYAGSRSTFSWELRFIRFEFRNGRRSNEKLLSVGLHYFCRIRSWAKEGLRLRLRDAAWHNIVKNYILHCRNSCLIF